MGNLSPLVLRFIKLLRWTEDDQAFADELVRIHADALSNRLGRTLAQVQSIDPSAFRDIDEIIRALPDRAFRRVLVAPQTCLRLAYKSSADLAAAVAYLREAVAFEAGTLNGWSCLGDLYRPAGGDNTDAQSSGPFAADRPWRTPALPNGPPIDYASPFARGPLPEVPGASVGFNDDEAAAVIALFQRAFAGIEAVPVAAASFRTFVRAVMLRKDPTVPSLRSASSSLTVGLVVFRNPHLNGVTIEDLAEGLIHELIHNICDIIELSEPFINDRQIANQMRINSPWSGRSLDLNTYIQACFVWYGLWEFWLTAFDSGKFNQRAAIRYFQSSSVGLQRGMIEPLKPVEHTLSPGLLEGLAAAQDRVQRALKELGVSTKIVA